MSAETGIVEVINVTFQVVGSNNVAVKLQREDKGGQFADVLAKRQFLTRTLYVHPSVFGDHVPTVGSLVILPFGTPQIIEAKMPEGVAAI